MDDKLFTVAEIAQLGFDKFSIVSSDTKAFERQIRNKIKDNNIDSVGTKKTVTIQNGHTRIAKNPAKAYSEDDKDRIINNLLFTYLKNLSSDETVQAFKSQSEYDEMAVIENDDYHEAVEKWQAEEIERQQHGYFGQLDEITPSSKYFISKKDEFVSEALYSVYFPKGRLVDSQQEIIVASALATILKSKFVREKIFELHYEYDEKALLKDMNEAHCAGSESAGAWTGNEMRLFEKLKDWKNYIIFK